MQKSFASRMLKERTKLLRPNVCTIFVYSQVPPFLAKPEFKHEREKWEAWKMDKTKEEELVGRVYKLELERRKAGKMRLEQKLQKQATFERKELKKLSPEQVTEQITRLVQLAQTQKATKLKNATLKTLGKPIESRKLTAIEQREAAERLAHRDEDKARALEETYTFKPKAPPKRLRPDEVSELTARLSSKRVTDSLGR
eukprot:TRINITY_DN3178_c0_g1_i2.p1 TRINITY_DN3178_c0_g1~~TRINITY_DN3178_c0_g1_i2.p1  ORF type:complete len:199 (-),score=39.01 TRINITY_DN3178_c0_g1_i2:20-616(-)